MLADPCLSVFLLYSSCFSPFSLFVLEKDEQTCLNAEKDDFDQQTDAKHLFAGQNTQHSYINYAFVNHCGNISHEWPKRAHFEVPT